MEPSPIQPTDESRRAELRKAARPIKAELRRHFLSERERLVADQIVEITLCYGIDRVRIPKLEVLGDLVGLDRSHIHTALKSLHEMRIITTAHKESAIVLSINLDSESWKVKPRIPRATVQRGLDVIREYNRIDSPLDSHSLFKAADPAPFLLPGVSESATVPDFPQNL